MSTQISAYSEMVSRMPPDTIVIWHNVSWEEYEDLLGQVSEGIGLRISYDRGTLQVMTLSDEHERYAQFIQSLVGAVRLRFRMKILSFGSATMKKRQSKKGSEPDASFYIQTAAALGNKLIRDFEIDPPPDIVVEVDVHHDSISKFPIYATFGVPEIWRYDGQETTIYRLQQGNYVVTATSQALPVLSAHTLTQFLTRLREEGESEAILAFNDWLQSQQQ